MGEASFVPLARSGKSGLCDRKLKFQNEPMVLCDNVGLHFIRWCGVGLSEEQN